MDFKTRFKAEYCLMQNEDNDKLELELAYTTHHQY